MLNSNFTPYNNDFMWFVIQAYIGIILPILAILDIYNTTRSRNPAPFKDLIIIFIICFGHCCYKSIVSAIRYNTLKLVCPTLGSYILLALVSVNGYIFYDYLNHRKRGGNYYIVFQSDSSASQVSANIVA
jgi:hypothetical protein